ncbi:MAG: hypothetical protein HYX22_02695 [Candidatus Yanofskybacteria bacterium]|nr:hypothetical protein [Candidatus Yanofskybacteria bacterium]
MWFKNARGHPKLIYFLIISACLNLVLLPPALWNMRNLKESLMSDKIIASIDTSAEDEEFIRKISEDLGLKSKITMFIDPYYEHSFFSPYLDYDIKKLLSEHPIAVDPKDPSRILMEKSIYGELNDSERKVAIAHSIGHIYIFIRDNGMVGPRQDFELQANRIILKYVNPNDIINFYHKYGSHTPGVQTLIDDLERQTLVREQGQ